MRNFPLSQVLGQHAPTLGIVDVGAMDMADAASASSTQTTSQPSTAAHISAHQRCEYARLISAASHNIIGFEPVKAECEKLNARAKQEHKTNHQFLPYFIGDGSQRTFHLTNFSATSSLFEPNPSVINLFNGLPELMQVVEKSTVATTRLDDIRELDQTPIDFLKMDIQGAELLALQGGRERLSNATVIWTEVEFLQLYKDQPLFAEVDQELRAQGFVLHHMFPPQGRTFRPVLVANDRNRAMNQVLWTDAIYVKSFSRLDLLTDRQLLTMATFLHDQLLSIDLTQVLLAEHDRRNNRFTAQGQPTEQSLWARYMKLFVG